MSDSMLKVTIPPRPYFVDERTGKPVPTVGRPTGEIIEHDCGECGRIHTEKVMEYHPDRRYKHVVLRHTEAYARYVHLYDSAA